MKNGNRMRVPVRRYQLERAGGLLEWTGLRIFVVCVLLLVPYSAAYSQSVMQLGFPRASILFFSPGNSYSRYADHILSMGDVNRDGIPDVFINACRDSTKETWMAFGTRPGIIDRWNFVRLEGFGPLAKGDVNGDGLSDLVVQSNWNQVSMYPGCASCRFTIDTVPAWRIGPEKINGTSSANFGEFIAVGDLNGDGHDDIAVAAPHWWTRDSGHVELGKVYLYLGGSNRFPLPDHVGVYPVIGFKFARYGLRIAEVNGDGFKDLIIGSHVSSVPFVSPENQYYDIFYGGTGFQFNPLNPDQRFGREAIPFSENLHSMEWMNVLDINNDGVEDLCIVDHNGYVFYGGPQGFRSNPDRIFARPQPADYNMGGFAHRISDINLDGFDDYLLSGSFGVGVGMAFIYLGSTVGMESYPVATAFNPTGGSGLAMEAIGLGDVDGDRVGDFACTFGGTGGEGFVVYGGRTWIRTPVEEIMSPHTPAIAAFPNPFRDGATIVVAGEAARCPSLAVHDIFGRRVRTLAAVEAYAGETRFTWDGRDVQGAKAPPGVYFYVIEMNHGMVKGKIVKQ